MFATLKEQISNQGQTLIPKDRYQSCLSMTEKTQLDEAESNQQAVWMFLGDQEEWRYWVLMEYIQTYDDDYSCEKVFLIIDKASASDVGHLDEEQHQQLWDMITKICVVEEE